jgi:hypothetical protein
VTVRPGIRTINPASVPTYTLYWGITSAIAAAIAAARKAATGT